MKKEILYEGKSKIVYRANSEDTCVIQYKDTATAFNGIKKEDLDNKGKLNAAISNTIFQYLERNGVKTHLIEVIDETSVLAKMVEIVPVEVIVRNIAAGSFSKKYGAEEGQALANTVYEFSLKSDALGDPMINETQITALSLATQEELATMTKMALTINDLMTSLFDKANITLVDFKLEFGRYKGEILLSDEISPDSCRLWDKATQKKMDKDRFRQDLGGVMEGYEEVLRRLKDVR